ncbi:MAG TPA: NADPH:quinone reductase [Tepidisphaeraceae bacterium]|nr:NADPH:quinone reductase [Tepidisphaeraceae bacterium]
MNAIRVHQFGEPDVLKFETVPDPKPAEGQVLVDVRAIGVNPVETYIRAGKYGTRQFPFTPGTDAAGVIESVGPGVTRFKPGQRVYTSGSITGVYAQKLLATEAQVHPLPEKVSFEQGAALGVPYATAYYALYLRAHALAGETVLVHGASGGVGTAAVQLAHAAGMTVIGTAGTDQGRKLVVEQGADHVLDHHASDYLKQLMALTGDQGVDVVLEMAAHLNLGKVLSVVAKLGRVIVIGSRGPVEVNPRDTMGRNADIRGMTLMNATPHELKGIHAALVAGLENGVLRPIIGKRMKLQDAAKAHQAVLEPGSYGKIILEPA